MAFYNAGKFYNRIMSDGGAKYNSGAFEVEVNDHAIGVDSCAANAFLTVNEYGTGLDGASITIYPAMRPKSYASKYLYKWGKQCLILRDPAIASRISIKRSTRSTRDLGAREGYWEGLILSESNLQSGEVIEFLGDKYLVQTANLDIASDETAFFAVKCNATVQHKRFIEDIDGGWPVIHADVPCYIEVVTYSLRQFDPGLLEQTRYIVQVSKSIGAVMLDRFVLDDGIKCQVVSINNAGLQGITILQLGIDNRQ